MQFAVCCMLGFLEIPLDVTLFLLWLSYPAQNQGMTDHMSDIAMTKEVESRRICGTFSTFANSILRLRGGLNPLNQNTPGGIAKNFDAEDQALATALEVHCIFTPKSIHHLLA